MGSIYIYIWCKFRQYNAKGCHGNKLCLTCTRTWYIWQIYPLLQFSFYHAQNSFAWGNRNIQVEPTRLIIHFNSKAMYSVILMNCNGIINEICDPFIESRVMWQTWFISVRIIRIDMHLRTFIGFDICMYTHWMLPYNTNSPYIFIISLYDFVFCCSAALIWFKVCWITP